MTQETLKDKIATVLIRIWIEIKYHYRVLGYLTFKQKVRYLYKQVLNRDCERRELCLGQASLKHLDTHHSDELSNYAFYCDRCHNEAQDALGKWWDAYLQEEEKRLSMTAELRVEWNHNTVEAKRVGSRSSRRT